MNNTDDSKRVDLMKALRKGSRAYLGLYGTAYARAKTRFDQVKTSTDDLYETLVIRGEGLETQAGEWLKTNQTNVTKHYANTSSKLRNILPTASNDRVEALEAEIAALNKKIATLGKVKKTSKATKVSMKTEKTNKAA